jgi:hypothetical protein
MRANKSMTRKKTASRATVLSNNTELRGSSLNLKLNEKSTNNSNRSGAAEAPVSHLLTQVAAHMLRPLACPSMTMTFHTMCPGRRLRWRGGEETCDVLIVSLKANE